jgi:Na+/H+ antiporter NhaA
VTPGSLSILHRLEHALEPWVAFGILPLFALSNAGVRLQIGIDALNPVTVDVLLGLFVGKQLGIAAVCWICVRAKIAMLPSGATWRQLYGVSLLCGITDGCRRTRASLRARAEAIASPVRTARDRSCWPPILWPRRS